VEGVRYHLSLVAKTMAKTQYTTPPWCHGGGWCKVTVSFLLPTLNPSSIVDDRARPPVDGNAL